MTTDESLENMNKKEFLNFIQTNINIINEGKKCSEDIKTIHSDLQIIYEKIPENNQKIEEIKEKFKSDSDKYESLLKKIENLLPGAASSSLASNFNKAKRKQNTVPLWFLFIGSLSILGFGYYLYFFKETNINLELLISRFLLGIPFIWLAWFAQKSILQIKKIREEYNHKEQMMRLYEGFNKYIKEFENESGGDNSLQKSLHEEVTKCISRNPAETLENNKTLIDDMKTFIIDKINSSKEIET
ncbi:MAG: hypothetical protein ACR2M7_01165 [Bdellovibrionales bacterium]